MESKSAVLLGGHRGLFGRMGAALVAALSAGGPAVGPTQRASRPHRAPRRASWKVSGGRKTGYPGQTPEQKARALEQAQAKRQRRAINCTENARRSAEGYHPWLQLLALHVSVDELKAQMAQLT